jgi:sigma-E factor negative regulatory protein RseB
MVPRPRPAVDGPRPGTEPTALWFITAAVVAGLLVTGITVVARAGAEPPGRAGPGRAALGVPLAGSALAGGVAAAAGLKLLGRAALACQTVPFHGIEILDWRGTAGPGTSVVDVWHAAGAPPLMRPALELPDLPGRTHHIVPPGDSDSAQSIDDDGMLGMSQRLVGLLGSNYRLAPGGPGQVAGRPAQLVTVSRPGGGLAARFWLDKATYLPLRRQMFGQDGAVVSDVSFSQLRFGPDAVAQLPAVAARPWGDVLAAGQLSQLRGSGWPLPQGSLPDDLALLSARESSTGDGQVIDLDYSDGLSVVSVFMQRGHLPAAMAGWAEVALHGHRVYADNADGHSIAWSARGFVYTVIAAAPQQTVGQVVSALPHDSPPSILDRLRAGMHRMTSWLHF